MMEKIKAVFISESIRRDSHAPLKYFKDVEPVHLYLNAPYGDMDKQDLASARQVDLKNLEDEIVKEKPDFIQGAEPFGSRLSLKLAYISYRASLKSKAKLVVPILENRPLNERFNLTQRAVLKLFCPKYFNHASAVVLLNKGAEKNVLFYARKARTIKNIVWGVWGVDTELFKPVAKKIPKQTIYVGRWIEDKGLKFMLEGFSQAQKEIPDLTLKLCGQGNYEAEMRKFAKENDLENNIEFVGQIKNIELPKYFSESELCIYPSITQKRWEEQVGTVNFQAMACETPVITTRSGAIPEYIKDGVGAILVEERNSDEIGKAILNYFKDEEHKIKLQKQARKYILCFDVKSEIGKAEELFKRLSNEK